MGVTIAVVTATGTREDVDKPVYVIGHRHPDTDSVCSAIAYAYLKNCLGDAQVRPARAGAIGAETAFVLSHFGVPVPELLSDAAGLDLILVDHNEVGQALPHIDQARILEIWEHHRLGDLHTAEPIVVHCEPVGATATLIAEQYVARGVTPPRAMAGMMIASILSDTLGFRSPTTHEKDRAVAARLQPVAGVDLEVFGQRLLQLKTAGAEQRPAAAVVGDDFKQFRIAGRQIGIAQVELVHPEALSRRKSEILGEMRAICDRQHLAQVILMITDVTRGASDLWVVGDQLEAIQQAFGPVTDNVVHVPHCMSRKKQVVPRLEAAFTDAAPPREHGGKTPA